MLAKYSAVVLYLVLMSIWINLQEQLITSRSIILLSTSTLISNTTRQKTVSTENDTNVFFKKMGYVRNIRIIHFSKRMAHCVDYILEATLCSTSSLSSSVMIRLTVSKYVMTKGYQ